LVDTLIRRLPSSDLAGLDLNEVKRIVALGYDVNFVSTATPISVQYVKPLRIQKSDSGIFASLSDFSFITIRFHLPN
jgi:hypothetical protein